MYDLKNTHLKKSFYFYALQKTVQSPVKHLAMACFVKCVLIQAVVNIMASMPATAAVASLSAV